MSLRERRFEESREWIIEAAREIIAEEGFDGLTMQRLARELGYTVGALYRYFPSKDALVVALITQVSEACFAFYFRCDDALAEHAARQGLSESEILLARLLGVGAAYRQWARAYPAEFRLIAQSIGDPEEITTTEEAVAAAPTLVEPVLRMSALFGQAQAAGVLGEGDPGHRGVCLWFSHHMLMLIGKFDRLGIDAFFGADFPRMTVRTLLIGWGADARAVETLDERVEKWMAELSKREGAQPAR